MPTKEVGVTVHVCTCTESRQIQSCVHFFCIITDSSSLSVCLFVGIVLVTDAMAAMDLPDGEHRLGQMTIDVKNGAARLVGKHTLAGR